MKNNFYIYFLILAFTFFGCPKRPIKTETQPTDLEEKTATLEPDIRKGDFISMQELKNVYFEYDKFNLTEEAKNVLKKNSEFLLANTQYEILVEGHCCECGSNEYNLGLGQKRANTVKNYYVSLGIPANRIATISYGEEKPINKNVAPPDSPLCKANRRAETKVRSKQ